MSNIRVALLADGEVCRHRNLLQVYDVGDAWRQEIVEPKMVR